MRSGLVLTLFSAIETQNIIKYLNDQFYQFR
jgi:hypothetical protein